MRILNVVFVSIAILSFGFFGCASTESIKKESDSKRNLTHIETKNRYMLSSELSDEESVHVAIINVVLPKGNDTTVVAELTFGSFRPRSNGKVYVQADTETVRYQSMIQLVNAISMRSLDPPFGIFMLVDDIAMGTDAAPDADIEVMTFTRELDSLLADENIQQVYLIPNSFSISYK